MVLAVDDSANSFASVEDVVTVCCLVASQPIGPPNRLKRDPWVDFRESLSSAKAALEDINSFLVDSCC